MKRREIEIINYLSGEMNAEEISVFEQQMESDPELNAEVESLRSAQTSMASWTDEQIEVPAFDAIDLAPSNFPEKQNKMAFSIRPWMQYAASAALLIGLLWLTGLQITTSNNALTLSFGPPETAVNLDHRIDQAVAQAINKYGGEQQAQFASSLETLNNNVSGIENAVALISNNWKNEKTGIQNMMTKLSDDQYQKFMSVIEQYQNNQDGKIQESFASLVEYLDDKRTDEFFQIENAFSEIVAAIDDQEERTNAMFESFIQPVVTNY